MTKGNAHHDLISEKTGFGSFASVASFSKPRPTQSKYLKISCNRNASDSASRYVSEEIMYASD